MKEMNGTNGTDGTTGTDAPPVANRPGAKVEEILALVKLAQRTEDAEELRGLLAGAKALCRHAIHKARYKAARAARAAIPGDDLEAVKGEGRAAVGKAYVTPLGAFLAGAIEELKAMQDAVASMATAGAVAAEPKEKGDGHE